MQGLYPIYKPRKNKENRRMKDIIRKERAKKMSPSYARESPEYVLQPKCPCIMPHVH